jgi:hypothetical protein
MSRTQRSLCLLSHAILLAALAACGGASDASLGGTVSGLPTGSSVTLQNNAANSLTVSTNGSFSFSSPLSAGASYSVTVLAQPTGSSCSVANASGSIDALGSDVSNVVVTCVPNATITGTVSGLASGTSLVLANGSVMLAIGADGRFAIPGLLAAGTVYNVTVSSQPVGQTCTVSNGVGTVVQDTQTAIVVLCS